jgi:hypothetical protein
MLGGEPPPFLEAAPMMRRMKMRMKMKMKMKMRITAAPFLPLSWFPA